MTDTQTPGRAQTSTTRTWRTGGALLLASVVVGAAVQNGIAPVSGGGVLSTVLYSSALLIFAFGIRGSGSVTALRPLGTTALAALAIWLLLGSVLQPIITASLIGGPGSSALLGFAYTDAVVQLALAIVAVVQIGRAGVVPTPWTWVPAWSLAAVAVFWLLVQLAGGSIVIAPDLLTTALVSLDALVRVGSTVLFGVLAILFAERAGRRA